MSRPTLKMTKREKVRATICTRASAMGRVGADVTGATGAYVRADGVASAQIYVPAHVVRVLPTRVHRRRSARAPPDPRVRPAHVVARAPGGVAERATS